MKKDIEAAVQRVDAAVAARDKALLTIGNLVHESVPVDNDEARDHVMEQQHEIACSCGFGSTPSFAAQLRRRHLT